MLNPNWVSREARLQPAKSDTVSFSSKDDSKDLSTWERGAPAPQCLSELLERQSGAGAPRSQERRTSFLQDLV